MLDGKIEGNSAGSNGGGLFAYNGAYVEITGGVFSGNTATNRGGAIYLYREKDSQDVPVATLKDVEIFDNVASVGSQVCVQYAVLEIGSGVSVDGGIQTVANPTETYAYIKFIDTELTEIEIDPYKYADYENEHFNVLRVADGVDATALVEKIKIKNAGYSVKTDGKNLYIYKLGA